ncbi:MAG: hypothetical protein GW911_25880, partial [Armatimonadetes bacterium]|nr:hypothetical protein [Armatimonadota bacterium]
MKTFSACVTCWRGHHMMFTPILIDWIVFSGENHWLTQPQWMSPGQLMVMMRPV